MNRPDTKRLTETVSSAASMTLFLIFAVCCLVIISVAAAAYGRINESYGSTFNSTAAVRYITNKVRACEGAEMLNGNQLLLHNSGYTTLIYEDGGAVYERLFPEGQEPVPNGGEELFSAEKLSLFLDGDMLTIEVTRSGETYTALCRITGGDSNA